MMVGSTMNAPVGWQTNASLAISGAGGVNSCLGTLPGVVDDVRLWSSALTPQQLDQGFMQSTSCQAAGLIADYPFDEGMGSTASSPCTGKGTLNIGGAMWTMSPFP
jgi:hypothetical protein